MIKQFTITLVDWYLQECSFISLAGAHHGRVERLV